jgi:hypothetical protein
MEKKRTIQVLFLGSVERTEEYAPEKATDEIDFGRPVRVTLVRIPKLKRELYGKLTSVTQVQNPSPRANLSKTSRSTSGTWMRLQGGTPC